MFRRTIGMLTLVAVIAVSGLFVDNANAQRGLFKRLFGKKCCDPCETHTRGNCGCPDIVCECDAVSKLCIQAAQPTGAIEQITQGPGGSGTIFYVYTAKCCNECSGIDEFGNPCCSSTYVGSQFLIECAEQITQVPQTCCYQTYGGHPCLDPSDYGVSCPNPSPSPFRPIRTRHDLGIHRDTKNNGPKYVSTSRPALYRDLSVNNNPLVVDIKDAFNLEKLNFVLKSKFKESGNSVQFAVFIVYKNEISSGQLEVVPQHYIAIQVVPNPPGISKIDYDDFNRNVKLGERSAYLKDASFINDPSNVYQFESIPLYYFSNRRLYQ